MTTKNITTKKKARRRTKVKTLKPAPPVITALSAAEYVNRELGALEFNSRVLHEAINPENPLLERVRFLTIFNSNLDEFFMKRVGGFKRQLQAGVTKKSADGLDALENLNLIRSKVQPLLALAANCFLKDISTQIEKHAIQLLNIEVLTSAEKEWANLYFRKNVFPVLTPLAVDPGHPFPFLSNLSVSLGVIVKHPDRDEKLFARIKVPRQLPQWVRIDSPENKDKFRFLSLISLIRENLKMLFPQMEIVGEMPFRVTRNADIERDEEDAEDLLEMIEEELRMRRFAKVVRLEHGANPDPWILKFLMDELELVESDVYEVPGLLDYTGLNVVADLPIPNLKFNSWSPTPALAFAEEDINIFSIIKKQDVLVHHPYEGFTTSVERFLKTAVDDPKVVAIKMTLYRTGDQSPLIPLLIRAADLGKQVVCLIELKARFDEARNIYWAQELEKAGIHVVYGIVGLKTHAKLMLIVREEQEGMQSYVHIGTGNYHAQTAKLYTDMGFFSSKEEYTSEVVELFHFLTGRSLKKDYKKLLVAPVNMRERFIEMIQRETANKKAGKPAHIIAKCNSLEDQQIMRYLYQASQVGVKVDLLVRGFCCIRPQVHGLSENITVTSIVGRFLEHSRLFYFRNGAKESLDGEFFMGSADWMFRNLNNRVEAIVPLEDRSHKEKVWEVLNVMLTDTVQAWCMQSDGTYKKVVSVESKTNEIKSLGTHEQLMQITRSRFQKAYEEIKRKKEIE